MKKVRHSAHFPSQAVSDIEKLSQKYGLEVAKAIREEWFSGATNMAKYHDYSLSLIHI